MELLIPPDLLQADQQRDELVAAHLLAAVVVEKQHGDAASITRTIHEWLQRTSIALNTWPASAEQLWHNALSLAKAAHQQWTVMAPSQRALQTG